jgi:SAM-dependent methyltransferase
VDHLLDIGRLRSRNKTAVRAGSLRDHKAQLYYDADRGLPFLDNSIDGAYAFRILETLRDPNALMEELWRVCKPGAAIYIRVPHSSSPMNTWSDPETKRAFNSQFFERYVPQSIWASNRVRARFYIDYMRLAHQAAGGWFAARNPLRLLFSGMMEAIANQHSGTVYRAEKWWGPVVGGFEELQVLLTVAKHESNPFRL